MVTAVLAALPVDLDYACMERGATLYERTGGVYRELAVLPPTYFVAVLETGGDGYCLVSYLDISGYMKESELKRVDFVPKTKYAQSRFTVTNDSQPANLRALPFRESEVSSVMDSGGGGRVIGYRDGDELIKGAGKRWYYVRYERGGDFVYGYVYSAHVTPEPFGVNSGERETPQVSDPAYTQDPPTVELSPAAVAVITPALWLPLLAVLLMLKPRKDDSPSSR